ncbi:thioesterase [Streptomyces sp. SID10815]|uniref:thioesterase II family protein n=1 Tax=Streptomyces sp. SID10815 TaxID=2706027 RepID=UPI0013CBAC4E|nr:thioesterase [Streptomyces sp. SID10815]NEA46423.1 thioesterase [Streptomyces sp. SID10815]
MRRTAWFPFPGRSAGGVELLCLPHAGAGASAYRAWATGLEHSGVAACPVQPPGRERRRDEPPFTDVRPLARALADEIAEVITGPFALFGHSTGALCAFETARQLRRIGGPRPVHLFVSGRPAPHLPLDRHDLAGMTLPELTETLRRLGGTPESVLSQQGLLAALQPVLAADFSVNEAYDHRAEPALDIPFTAFAGEQDGGAGPRDTAAWAEHTTESFRLHVLEGGHFAVFAHAERVHALVAEALADHVPPARGPAGHVDTQQEELSR